MELSSFILDLHRNLFNSIKRVSGVVILTVLLYAAELQGSTRFTFSREQV